MNKINFYSEEKQLILKFDYCDCGLCYQPLIVIRLPMGPIKKKKTLKKIFFWCLHLLATFISFSIEYVIASNAYIHPVYSSIRTQDLLDVSLLP